MEKGCIQGIMKKSREKRQLRRQRRSCEDNIKMKLKRRRVGGMQWIRVPDDNQLRVLVNAAVKLWVP